MRRRDRWQVLVAVFFFGWVLMYANRTILSPVMKVLEVEWGLSRTELGVINSAFFVSYALLQVPAGLLGDRLSRLGVLISGYIVHGLGMLITTLVRGPAEFLWARVATGLGQSTYYSTQYALASAAVPPERRVLGLALINAGMSFGILVGWGLGGLFVYACDLPWRVAFLVLGVVTLGATTLTGVLVREPPTAPLSDHLPSTPTATQQGAAQEDVGSAGEGTQSKPRKVYGNLRNLILACVTSCCSMYAFYMILTWLPYYLQTVRGMDGARAGLVSTFLPLLSVPASLIAAVKVDRLGRRRPALMVFLPLSALAVWLIGLVPHQAGLYGGLLLYGLTGKLVLDPLLVAVTADNSARDSYATVFGVLNFAATIPTFLAPAVTGWLADVTGGFAAAFWLAGGLLLLGTVTAGALREAERPVRSPSCAGGPFARGSAPPD